LSTSFHSKDCIVWFIYSCSILQRGRESLVIRVFIYLYKFTNHETLSYWPVLRAAV
jgi:hypothetical protein